MGQAVPAENGIGAVEESAADAQQQPVPGHGQPAAEDPRGEAAPQEGDDQGGQLSFGDLLPPQDGRQHHHEGRGGVQEDGGSGQVGDLLAPEVAQGEEQQAHQACAQENGQVPEPDAEETPVIEKEDQDQDHAGSQVPHQDDVLGGKPQSGEVAVE